MELKFVINGRFLARAITGTERFAREVVIELDKIVEQGEIKVLAPDYAVNGLDLSNIRIEKYGNVTSHLWEQISLLFYIKRHKSICINLCNTASLFSPDIAVIHDICYKTRSEFYKSTRAKISAYWHRLHYWFICRKAKHILTVSEFSKMQIMQVYGVDSKQISVIGNGWQHFENICFDDYIYEEFPELKSHPFVLTLGSLAANKNLQWVIENAKKTPKFLFCISGGKTKNKVELPRATPNVIFLGRLSDEQLKTLMRDCKAFLFPSFYEGFGIPPLEALSIGAKIVVSDIDVHREVYEDAAYYIDPHNSNIDLDELLEQEVGDAKQILAKYSWERSAKKLYEIMKKVAEQ